MMSLTIKKTALAAAIGLSISASPVGAFPFWSFTGFGSSGALGGDNQWAPFDGRYLLKNGGMRFDADFQTDGFAIGTLTLEMELEGRAYHFPDTFPGSSSVDIIDPTDDEPDSGDEYIALGDFSFNMTFDDAFFGQDGEDFFLNVPSFTTAQGTLTYDTDVVFDDTNDNGVWDENEVDISVDGEREGDIVLFSTPDCSQLINNPGRSDAECSFDFFQMFATGEAPADAYTPVDLQGGAFDNPLGTSIPTGVISLFHAGLPCPAGDLPATGTPEAFYCNPIPENFPTSGIPYLVDGQPVYKDQQQLIYETYAEYVAGFNPPGHVAFINVQATPTNVPTPATGLLLGAGLAGLGFARRRAKARSVK